MWINASTAFSSLDRVAISLHEVIEATTFPSVIVLERQDGVALEQRQHHSALVTF